MSMLLARFWDTACSKGKAVIRKNYSKNVIWLSVERITRIAISFLVGILVARYLGPEQYGLLHYSISLVFLFSVFCTLGLDNVVIKELVKADIPRDTVLGTAFLLKCIGAVFSIIFVLIAILFLGGSLEEKFLVLIVAVASVFTIFSVIDFYFQSEVMSKYVAWANFLVTFVSGLIKITLLYLNASLLFFAGVIVVEGALLASALVVFYRLNGLSLLRWRFDWAIGQKLLLESWPLIASAFLIALYMKIDQVMLKFMAGSEAVGQYAVAVQISEAWYFFPIIIVGSLFPAIINAKQRSHDEYILKMTRLYSLVISMSICVAILIWLFGTPLINGLYGDQYFASGSIVEVHAWAGVFVAMGLVYSRFLVCEGLTKKSFYRNLLGAVANVLLNIYLIPRFGGIGAAWATVLALSLSSYWYDLFDKDVRGQFYVKSRALNPLMILRK